MQDQKQLPLGIRLNNPGNLRGYTNTDYSDPYVDGFAHFRTSLDGLQALFSQIWLSYSKHGDRTLKAFVSRWAPASENDVARYMLLMSQFIGQSPMAHSTKDLSLNWPMSALIFARAIITVEQGYPPSSWPAGNFWYTPSEMIAAMTASNRWSQL